MSSGFAQALPARGNVTVPPRYCLVAELLRQKHWLHESGLCSFPTDIALPWNGFAGGEEQTYVIAISLAVLHRWLNPSSYGIHCRQTSCEKAQCQPNTDMNRQNEKKPHTTTLYIIQGKEINIQLLNSIFIVCEFKEGLEGGGAVRWGYKIQKVLFATPCCKLRVHKNKWPALVATGLGFFLLCVHMHAWV